MASARPATRRPRLASHLIWRNQPRSAAWAPIEKIGLAFAKTGHTRRVDISEQTFADDSARQLDFLQELDNRKSVLDRTGTVLRASALPSSSAASALHTAVRTPCLASLGAMLETCGSAGEGCTFPLIE